MILNAYISSAESFCLFLEGGGWGEGVYEREREERCIGVDDNGFGLFLGFGES